MLYPPDPQTEQATMREAFLCHRENITINMFCVPSWSQSESDVRVCSPHDVGDKGPSHLHGRSRPGSICRLGLREPEARDLGLRLTQLGD